MFTFQKLVLKVLLTTSWVTRKGTVWSPLSDCVSSSVVVGVFGLSYTQIRGCRTSVGVLGQCLFLSCSSVNSNSLSSDIWKWFRTALTTEHVDFSCCGVFGLVLNVQGSWGSITGQRRQTGFYRALKPKEEKHHRVSGLMHSREFGLTFPLHYLHVDWCEETLACRMTFWGHVAEGRTF